MILRRTDGLWTKRYEIGEYFGAKKDEVFVVFGGPTNAEMAKIREAETCIFSGEGVEMEFQGKDGKTEKRTVNPAAIQRRDEAVADCMCRHIVEHNLFRADEKNPDGIKLTDKEVWSWICDRAELAYDLMTDWRASIPFASA